MTDYHVPVLACESVDALAVRPDGVYVDLTFGGGGHTRQILSRLGKRGTLVAFDQDADAAANLPDDPRVRFIRSNFRFMRACLRLHGIERADGILADLGVSSHHFDTEERGFSFRFDSRLDMRMNRDAELTAFEVVNRYPVARLIAVLRDYGELPAPHRIAGFIEKARGEAPIETTGQLIESVRGLIPRRDESKFLAKLFQALRIEVNRETEALEMMLEQSVKVLRPGGRLAVITYHSLEDRLVKNFIRTGDFGGRNGRDLYGRSLSPFEPVFARAVTPSEEEVAVNPRARSAKLRAAVRR